MLLLTTWSFGLRAGASPWESLRGGASALDAVEATCIAAEDDPGVDSVGFGGLPDRDGRVTLDGCVMLSPGRCGSVCAVTRTRHPVSLARRVMERTPHVMLAGPGADAFAEAEGMPSESLLSSSAREAWERWRAKPGVTDQSRDRQAPPRPVDRGPLGRGSLFAIEGTSPQRVRSAAEPPDPGASTRVDPNLHHDTIGVLAIDGSGAMAGACSTSGTPYKIPGRVGDSPIIGHGLYVDPAVGAATATGAGELITGVCGSFLVVEAMRRGDPPDTAVRGALARIAGTRALEPHHQVAFIALAADGRWSAGALRPGYKTSVFDLDRKAAVDPELQLLDD